MADHRINLNSRLLYDDLWKDAAAGLPEADDAREMLARLSHFGQEFAQSLHNFFG